MTILCIASYFKGQAFLQSCKAQGCTVLLLTAKHLEQEDWPRESIDDTFYIEGEGDSWDRQTLLTGVSYLARSTKIDRIVPLDDFDLEKAALLREHLRIPGMGDTRTRYFRDKLAMRSQAQSCGIPVPDFVHVLNYNGIRDFCARTDAPWVLKPRSQASGTGIVKIKDEHTLWQTIEGLGDEQSYYLLEQFIPGTIYHVDSIVMDEEVVFARASTYTETPLEVAQGGGVFGTRTLAVGSDEEVRLQQINKDVIQAMGLVRGVSHTEFIRSHTGTFFFLETSARVGGAHIAEMVEAASGINLWAEWARIEALSEGAHYQLPSDLGYAAGMLISLARQPNPDTSGYTDPEILWRLQKDHHVGLIVQSQDHTRIQSLLEAYIPRFQDDFMAIAPQSEKPTH